MSSGSKRETGRLFVCCIVASAYPLEIPSDCQAVQQETLMFSAASSCANLRAAIFAMPENFLHFPVSNNA